MMRLYFDHNATTPLAPGILEKMPSWMRLYGNPSSIHREGRESRKALEDARRRVSARLGSFHDEVVFLSGASEANAQIFQSIWETRGPGRDEILISAVEHDAVERNARFLEERGARILRIPVGRNGELDLGFMEERLSSRTLFVSVMRANNETGFVFPLREIALLCRQKGVPVHTDAACALGKMDFDFQGLGIDFVSFSAHKFYGPKGIGGMLVRRGTPLNALIRGGSQERGFRSGTENLPAIMGLAEGLDFALEGFAQEQERLRGLRALLKAGLKKAVPGIRFLEALDQEAQLPGTLSCLIPQVSGQTFLAALDLAGVAASLGSACHSGALEVSRVILALGVPEEEARGVVRFSFGKTTTDHEIKELVQIVRDVFFRCTE